MISAVQEFFHSRKWTYGLPIVPPTEVAVPAMLDRVVMPAGLSAVTATGEHFLFKFENLDRKKGLTS